MAYLMLLFVLDILKLPIRLLLHIFQVRNMIQNHKHFEHKFLEQQVFVVFQFMIVTFHIYIIIKYKKFYNIILILIF